MLSIGDFSQASRLSIKTLRYYHELGLLLPEKIDSVTGYRFYSQKSLERAGEIARWKEMGFTLSEIAELIPLQQRGDVSALERYVREKARQLDQKEQEFRRKRERLEQWKPDLPVTGELVGDVFLLEEPELQYIYVPVKGPYHKIGEGFAKLYSPGPQSITGPPFALYFTLGFEDEPEMLACSPGRSNSLTSEIQNARLEEGPWICQRFRGPYDRLGLGYQAMFEACEARGLKAIPPAREIYLEGPGDRKPDDYLTELRMRVR